MPKRRFPKPRKRLIDIKEVRKYLKRINFEVDVISQAWRHVLAMGKYKGKDAVFKLASTQETGKRTLNEYYWNEAVNLADKKTHPSFFVPENYSSGYYGKLFYFIAEKFPGSPLIANHQDVNERLKKNIPLIAKVTFELENLCVPSNCSFVLTQKAEYQSTVSPGLRLMQSSEEWAKQVPLNLNDYLGVISGSMDKIRTSVSHGDFVARQMYPLKGRIGIIDGEHAGIKGVLYYDVAQFYIRLRNDHKAEPLARKYILEFKKLLDKKDQNTFWGELKPVLIQRYIGDLWGAAKYPKKLEELKSLGEDILQNKII